MNRDTLIIGALAALNLVAVTVTSVVTGSIPDVLGVTLKTLIGATAGVAASSRKTPL